MNNWATLKRNLKPLQGKAIFILKRENSLNDGEFLRVLHQVKPHELVFFDGKQKTYLSINKDSENKVELLENGFKYLNCKYTISKIMEAEHGNI